MVMVPPTSSQRQATNNPKIATPHKLNRNQSSVGTGPMAYGSGVKIINRATTNTPMLQMRAIQRMIFTELWATLTARIRYPFVKSKPSSSGILG